MTFCLLLLPMGFGAILVNLPYSGVIDQVVQGKIPAAGIIEWLYRTGIESSEMMPILLFIGIFVAILIACLMGFDLKDAASIALMP